jgi:hypothetical protein
VLRACGRISQEPEEPLPDGEVQSDEQCGPHGCRGFRPRARDRAFHPVEQASFDVCSHDGVEPELVAEVVVERAGGDRRRRCQLDDRDLVEGTHAELPDGGEREPALRGGRHRNPLVHGSIMPLC